MPDGLDAGYRAKAGDAALEREAAEWSEALIHDMRSGESRDAGGGAARALSGKSQRAACFSKIREWH